MGLVKNAVIASAALFAGSWVSLQLLKTHIDDILVRATFELLLDPDVEENIFEYLNKIVDKSFQNDEFKKNLIDFYCRVIQHQITKDATKTLLVNAFIDKKAMLNAYVLFTNSFHRVRQVRKSFRLNDIDIDKMFKWRSYRTDARLIPLMKLSESVLDFRYLLLHNSLMGLQRFNIDSNFREYVKTLDRPIEFTLQAFKAQAIALSPSSISSISKSIFVTLPRSQLLFVNKKPASSEDDFITY